MIERLFRDRPLVLRKYVQVLQEETSKASWTMQQSP